MDIEMLPRGDGCQCADCRAERGDTQFAEFMDRVGRPGRVPVEKESADEQGESR